MGTRRAVKTTTSVKAGTSKVVSAKRTVSQPAPVQAKRPVVLPEASIEGFDLEDVGPGDEGLMRDDPVRDRRIIEGMLHDREALMGEMREHGFDKNQVLRRAAELGLSEALIRQVRGVAADLAGDRPTRAPAPTSLGARTCLCCDRVFLSAGPGNRLCMRCRGGDAGLAQL